MDRRRRRGGGPLLTAKGLRQLQAANLPKLTLTTLPGAHHLARELFTPAREVATIAGREAIDAYLAGFTLELNTDGDIVCPGCRRRLSFGWGLRHGSGHCHWCSWPCVAYHFNVGPHERLEGILPVHPDHVAMSRGARRRRREKE